MADTEITLLSPPFPTVESYTPLTEHESSTPSTFFGAKPVLYAETGACDICVYKGDVDGDSVWTEFLGDASLKDASGNAASDETQSITTDGQQDSPQADDSYFNEKDWYIRRGVHGYVNSRSLTIVTGSETIGAQSNDTVGTYTTTSSSAISIPYPAISIHAVRNISIRPQSIPTSRLTAIPGGTASAIYLQIEMAKGIDREDQDEGTVEVLIIPRAQAVSSIATTGSEQVNGDEESENPPQGNNHQSQDEAFATAESNPTAPPANKPKVQDIYDALCRCADLHPDPMDEDEDGEEGQNQSGLMSMLSAGGDLESVLASGGWITSENAHEFAGEFPQMNEQTAGAGGESNQQNVAGLGPGAGSRRSREDDPEQTTDEASDESKWQRTG